MANNYINKIKKSSSENSSEIFIQDYRIKDFPENSAGKALVIAENGEVIPKILDYLSLTGGKLSGILDMSKFKIINLFPGSNESDAVTYGQLQTAIQNLGNVFILKGVLQSLDDLPIANVEIGNIYYINEEMTAYVWLEDDFTSTISAGELQKQIIISEIAVKLQLIEIQAISASTQNPVKFSYIINDNNIIVTLDSINTSDVIVSGKVNWWGKFGSEIDLSPYVTYEQMNPIIDQYVTSAISPLKDLVNNAIQNPIGTQENEILTYKNGKWVNSPIPDTGVINIIPDDLSLNVNSDNKSAPKIKVNISKKDKNTIQLITTEGEEGLYSVGTQSDFTEIDDKNPSYIKNKPLILDGDITTYNHDALVNDTQVKKYYDTAKIQIADSDKYFTDLSEIWINTSNNPGGQYEYVSSVNGKTGAVVLKTSDIYYENNIYLNKKLESLDSIDAELTNSISEINLKLNDLDVSVPLAELTTTVNKNKLDIKELKEFTQENLSSLNELKEDKSNKVNSIFGNESNEVKYPSTKAVSDLLNNTVYTEAEGQTLYINFVPTEFYGLRAELLMLDKNATASLVYNKGILSLSLPKPRDAYDIAIDNGYDGSEVDWLKSLAGRVEVDYIQEEEALDFGNKIRPYIEVDNTFIPTLSEEDLNKIFELTATPQIISPTYVFTMQSTNKWVAIDYINNNIHLHVIELNNNEWTYSDIEIK